jgi:O-antigen/teichoic acid export membrane protein
MMKLLSNKVFVFVLTRYFSYVIQFINSLVVAYVLGPYYLGIWGFIQLVIQYLAFGNFGIDIALNVSLSTGDLSDSKKQSVTASNAVMATFFTSLIFIIAGLIPTLAGVELFPKYGFTPYLMPVIAISCLNYFNIVFLNICRAYSQFAPISIFQTLLQLLQLPVMFMFRDVVLLWALLVVMAVAHLVSLVLFIRRLPLKLNLKPDAAIIKGLYSRGIVLISYAITFYVLLLSTRSLVGYFYPVESMGLFTFAANIASALIVGLSSLEFVLFPKMINRLSFEITDKLLQTFRDIRFIYISIAFIVVLIGVIFYPVILIFFGEYRKTSTVFTFLAFCQVIISAGFGYAALIISRQKEIYLVYHGLVALVINLLLSVGARTIFNVSFEWMAFFLIFAFVYYDYQVIRIGRRLMGLPVSAGLIMRDLFPSRSLPSLLFLACGVLFPYQWAFNAAALIIFVALNAGKTGLVLRYIKLLFHKPAVVNI